MPATVPVPIQPRIAVSMDLVAASAIKGMMATATKWAITPPTTIQEEKEDQMYAVGTVANIASGTRRDVMV